MRNGEQYVV
jgi:tubulin polyglutamylase TTLL6/13